MTHPHTALHNAQKYFKLNALEKEMILKHMFPVTPIPPMHKETWIITLTDKYCGTCEIGQYYFHVWFPRGVYHAMKHLMKKIFGKDYTYADYRLPFGEFSEDAADRGVNFAKLRKRSESESEWKNPIKKTMCSEILTVCNQNAGYNCVCKLNHGCKSCCLKYKCSNAPE